MMKSFKDSLREINGKTKNTLIFGGAAISGSAGGHSYGALNEEAARALISYFWEKGGRIFDTAPIYGFGDSEKRLGKTLSFLAKRNEYLLISKGGISWHRNMRVNVSNDPSLLARMIDESLKRLMTHYIDLYMIHWPDPRVDIRKALGPLMRAKEEGLIRYIGLSNTSVLDLKKASEVCSIAAIQNEHNHFLPLEPAIAKYCETENICLIGHSPLAKGILTGRATIERKYDRSDYRSWAPWWKKDPFLEKKMKAVKLLEEKLGKSELLNFALSVYREANAPKFFSIGATTISQWSEIFLEKELDPHLYAEGKEIIESLRPLS